MAQTPTKDRARPETDPALVAGLAPLTEAEIKDQTDDGSFSRGRSYYRSQQIFDPVRRGTTLRAQCHGSSGGPYVVEATMAAAGVEVDENPVYFDCDCPRGGFCKHVVAMLLTWVHEPERFEPRPPVAELLAAKSREELVALVESMVRQDPDLETFLELPTPVAGAPGDEPVDEAALRRQIAVALRDDDGYSRRGRSGDYDYYHAGARIAAKLGRLVALGTAYADAGRWRQALAVCATFLDEVLPQFETIRDDDGNLHVLVGECDRALAAGLDAQGGLPAAERLSTEERTRLIKALYDIWQTDIAVGGQDLSQEGPEAIGRGTTEEEQRLVAGWLRAAIKPAEEHDYHDAWFNQAAIGFLSLLAGEAGLSDEDLLAEYRDAELWEEAAATLVKTGRVEEAIALAARRFPSAIVLTRFADDLVATGDLLRIEQAIALVDGRLWEREGQNAHDDVRAMEWLERHYAVHGQPAKALDLARRRFKAAPSETTYDAVKTAALLPGQPGAPWPKLRPELLATLRKQGQAGALIQIHLADGEVAEALSVLKQTGRGAGGAAWGWGGASAHEARVAAAAERDFPADAIRLYRGLAARQIEARQRANYREAAAFLARVKMLLAAADRGDNWRTLITDLRQEHKTLRALREELDALGLA